MTTNNKIFSNPSNTRKLSGGLLAISKFDNAGSLVVRTSTFSISIPIIRSVSYYSNKKVVEVPVVLNHSTHPLQSEVLKLLFNKFSRFTNLLEFTDSDLANFFTMQKSLYDLSGATYGDYSLENINQHVNSLMRFTSFDYEGFVGLAALDNNSYIILMRSLFPTFEDQFRSVRGSEECDRNPRVYDEVLFLTTHLINILCLYLIIELKISLKVGITPSNVELYENLGIKQKSLLKHINPGIRSELSRRHFGFINKIYAGYDTEFETQEVRSVKLQCYTLATYDQSYFRYKPLNIDYTTDVLGKGLGSKE